MDVFTFILLCVGLVVLCTTLVLVTLLRTKIAREHGRKDTDAVLRIELHRVIQDLTSISWLVEMLLGRDLGKLKLSQIEVLHQVQKASKDALEGLQTMEKSPELQQSAQQVIAAQANVQSHGGAASLFTTKLHDEWGVK